MKEKIIGYIEHFYWSKNGEVYSFDKQHYTEQVPYWAAGMFLGSVILFFILWLVTRKILVTGINALMRRSKVTWDDHFITNKVFNALGYFVPLMVMKPAWEITFFHYPTWHRVAMKGIDALLIVVVMIAVNRTLNVFRDILKEKELYKDKPVQSYFQISKITASGIFLILLLASLTNQSPLFFLTSLGAMTAILVLVFKDTILGFVGSIQLAANDMIRIGDWVTMEKYGADGTVEEINLTTVKVRNFDKTITTIPTYAFIADSFINWRGMQESNGRRLKRSLSIQMESIHFADPELIKRLSNIKILREYIEETERTVEIYNNQFGFDENDRINARRQTNIGLFRKYVELYLYHHPDVNNTMPLLSRQMNPSPTGVPIEIYCFIASKEWQEFERISADIFDHLFAVISEFELEIFESPSGRDIRQAINGKLLG